jgi:predicted acetyltransferase
MSAAPQTLPIRAIREDEWPQMVAVDSHAFGMSTEEDVLAAERTLQEPGRSIGAFDGDTLAAVAAAYSFDLTVPGRVLPAAGVSWVGVLPTHRRRGLLRALMTYQLHELRDRGREPVAALWASEPAIYGRFGYGLASRALELTVPRDPEALGPDAPADPALRMRLVDPADRATAQVYDAAAPLRAGMIGRDERWHARAASDWPSVRSGRSALRCVVAEGPDGPRGYARYATKQDWSGGYAAGRVDVRELVALDSSARAHLYRFLLDLDLMGETRLVNVPLDDPVLHWLRDPRRASPQLLDALYVRLVDLPAALGARTYSAPVDVVVEVRDAVCDWNDGRWRLEGGPDGAGCVPSTDEPDLQTGVTELGAAFLGGTTLAELGLAGRVAECRPGALARTSAAFAGSPQPWCPAVF